MAQDESKIVTKKMGDPAAVVKFLYADLECSETNYSFPLFRMSLCT